jgi:SNF2 family DNA or RNA helicase
MLQELWPGLPYLGQGVSDRQAATHVEAWNARRLPLLALHPASGGHGLNLQHGGSQIAWLNLTWSPELYEQTVARIVRPGQTQKCFVHICIAENTVDEVKRLRVLHKMGLQEAFAVWLKKV